MLNSEIKILNLKNEQGQDLNYLGDKEEIVKKLMISLIDNMQSIYKSLGLNVELNYKELDLLESEFFTYIMKIINYNKFTNNELSNNYFEMHDKIENILTKSFIELIKDEEINEFYNNLLKPKLENIESEIDFNDYITQAEASRILEKDVGYVANMLNKLGLKHFNGRPMLNKEKVLEYKKILDKKAELKNDEDYMSIKEVAKYLKRSEDYIYKIINSGELVVEGEEIKYVRKEEVERYKQVMEDIYLKYNCYDYFTVKEASVLMGVSKQTVNNLIQNNEVFNVVELVGKVYFIPRNEMIKGIEYKKRNADYVLKERDTKLVKLLKSMIQALKNDTFVNIPLNSKDFKKLKVEFDNNGMNYIYTENLKRLRRGEEIYIPTI